MWPTVVGLYSALSVPAVLGRIEHLSATHAPPLFNLSKMYAYSM